VLTCPVKGLSAATRLGVGRVSAATAFRRATLTG
jgi:hypothetical protein